MPEYEIFINSKVRKIELEKTGENVFTVKLDGKPINAGLPVNKLDFGKEFLIEVDGKKYRVSISKTEHEKPVSVKVEEVAFKAEVKTPMRKPSITFFELAPLAPAKKAPTTKQVVEGAVTAPMTGKILSIKVKKGDAVKAGQVLCVLEAMKMENEIAAPFAGTIREVYVSEGSSVSEGEPLFLIS